ncbi:hypothetical protein E4U22_006752 [Claviceps purpurea]|uniref:Large ribosomal subunit protein mL53 n=2 Tax=Claviceps TaxID=5110 RepID=M1WBX1_CLAP2|nr:hypothetical protein E4U28_007879 [Claviceps purpurea]KAG6291141.1 hypothetical protein E4U09_004070 [Claviceps aff. purpurea]CCE31323.1 probable ribosomal protein YmL44, mitochondrial [Claviceps purpurea 20.1]KAG6129598.1 hypothetical protein E4U12_004590 [Claviceps purpurea]KAG6156971.1 hypothetical protein E4U37_007981 [Claviceps purpurea]
MHTRFITKVTARFNPFSVCAKPARLFLTYLPPNARASGTSVETILLPRNTTEPSSLKVDFKDGKQLAFNCSRIPINMLVEEVERHCRALQKASDLSD